MARFLHVQPLARFLLSAAWRSLGSENISIDSDPKLRYNIYLGRQNKQLPPQKAFSAHKPEALGSYKILEVRGAIF